MKPEICEVRLTVPQKDIYYISWIIDAAEGLGFLRTDDAKAGRVTIYTPKELYGDLMGLVGALRAEGLEIQKTEEEDDKPASCNETTDTGEIK